MRSIRGCASNAWRRRNEPAQLCRTGRWSERMNPVEFVRKEHAALTAVRRDLHAHPELGFEEHRTAEVLRRELDALGVEHHDGIGKTGIVAVIPGVKTESGRAIGLRADMDERAMHEEKQCAHGARS